MAYDFDRNHQGGEPQDGAEKMLEVLDPMGFDPVEMGGKKYDQGTGYGGIQIVGGREKARNQTENVGEEDEKPQGPNQGEELPPPVSEDIIQESQNHLDKELEDIPQGETIRWDERLFLGPGNGHFPEGQIG